MSLKETSPDIGKPESLPKDLILTCTATRYLNRNSHFYSYKAGKNKYTIYSNLFMQNHFLRSHFLHEKNQIGTMIYFHRLPILL